METLKNALSLALVLALCAALMLPAGAAFADVKADSQYAQAIDLLSSLGVVAGDESGFRPGDNIKRSEFCKIAYVIYTGTSDAAAFTGKSQFTDVADNAWFNGYVNWAVQKEIVGGMGDGTFAPDASVTIEQVIKMLVVGILGAPENPVWPTTYLQMANKTGLCDNVTYSATNAAATREQVAQFGCNAIFEASVLLSATPNEKFFSSAVRPIPAGSTKYFLAGTSADARGASGMTAEGQIVLAASITPDAETAAILYNDTVVAKCGRDVSAMLSTWVYAKLDSAGEVVSIVPAYKTISTRACMGFNDGLDYTLKEKIVQIADDFDNYCYYMGLDGRLYWGKNADPARKAYLFHTSTKGGWNGARSDERVTYSFDESGKLFSGVVMTVNNGVLITGLTDTAISLAEAGGSRILAPAMENVPLANVTAYEGVAVGDYVNMILRVNYKGDITVELNKAEIRIGTLTSTGTITDNVFDIGFMAGIYHRNGSSIAINDVLKNAPAGTKFKLVMCEAGFIAVPILID